MDKSRIHIYSNGKVNSLDDEAFRVVRNLILSAYHEVRSDLDENDIQLSSPSCSALSRELDTLTKLKRLVDVQQIVFTETEDADHEQP
jgi:hypothetical protein